MWRYLVGGLATLALVAAGMLLFNRGARSVAALPSAPLALAQTTDGGALPARVPEASDKTREQKRFDRYDKDRNEAVSRDEYFAARHKAFAKLDSNGDGKLSFEEWAAKSIAKFTGADADKSGTLTRTEFATTAPTRKPSAARCACAKPAPAPSATAKDGDDEN